MSARPRKSTNITISTNYKNNPNDPNYSFDMVFSSPIQIPINSKPKVYPVSFSSIFNWFNVSTQYDNLQLVYFSGTNSVSRTVNFPAGQYSVKDLNNFLVAYQQTNGDGTGTGVNFVPDFNYQINGIQGTVSVVINTASTVVNFSNPLSAGQAKLIGFPLVDVSTSTEGGYPDITAGVSEIEIHTSLVNNSGISVSANDVILTFQPSDEQPFANFIIEPSVKTLFSVSPGQINSITLRITDQLQRPFDITGNFPTKVPVMLRCVLEYEDSE